MEQGPGWPADETGNSILSFAIWGSHFYREQYGRDGNKRYQQLISGRMKSASVCISPLLPNMSMTTAV